MATTSQKFCLQCGGTVDTDARFCKHCAFDLSNSAQSSDTSVIPPKAQPNTNSKPVFLIGGVAVAGLLMLVILGAYIFTRNRAQPATATASPIPVSAPTMNNRAKQVEAKILRGESLNDSDIAGLSAYELRVLRNVHFARYGREYDRPGLGDYFYTQSWYKPSDSYNDSMLTSTDKANINLIVAAEKPEGNPDITSTNANVTTADSVSSPTSQSSSLEDQAISYVRKMVEDKWFTRCGDSYFSQDMSGTALTGYVGSLAQRRNVTYVISQAYPLTEADRLNDVRWRGKVRLQYSAKRTSTSGVWADWQPYQPLVKYEFSASLRGSNWNASGATYLLDTGHRKVNCSSILKS